MSILKRKKKEEEEDDLEKILSELKENDEGNDVTTVTIQIAGLKELTKAIQELAEAMKKCNS
ncbi:conserved hypothetical protein [Pyrobaculum islandicum DSM 4184]|uniref:Uncharacterized protein n=1 Tax=Pyrobaculum islandicum (strain DSM 4184 / JCM 9189 / GEO3) TaxID=384616 RepID=A1RRH8_PYRIL|nr:hypothetical protein [Pyrobaculum islandicum]ABL87560.1 conserved hypothetical protein [Pyrobaculum islandicum DSM 4184]